MNTIIKYLYDLVCKCCRSRKQTLASDIGRRPSNSDRAEVKLRSISSAWLNDSFACKKFDEDWGGDSVRLMSLNLPEMTGGMNPGDCRALYYLVRRIKPRRVLEIGTHIGSSTLALALAASRNQAEGIDTRIVTVDILDVNDEFSQPWVMSGSPASPRELLRALQLDDLVTFEVGPSMEKMSHFAPDFEMILLDGDHSFEAVYNEIPLALRRLSRDGNGTIILHDYFPKLQPIWVGQEPITGPFCAVEEHIKSGASFSALPLGNLPWPTKLGGNLTSLAVLTR